MNPVEATPAGEPVPQLFLGLTTSQTVAAFAVGKIQEFAAGSFIFRDQGSADAMFLVLSGSVALVKPLSNGHEQLLETIHAGGHFGEMGLIDQRARTADAVVRAHARLIVLHQTDLDQLLMISPRINLNLVRSVTARLRTTTDRFITQAVYQGKMSLVGQMAGSIIHDFRSPMTVIRLTAEMLAQNPSEKTVALGCTRIIRHVDRLNRMSHDLLDFSRGACQLERSHVDPSIWLQETCNLLQPILQPNHVALVCDIQTTDRIHIDAERMTRVIYNLANNSIEAMPHGGTLTLRLQKTSEHLLIVVTDNGPGIPEAIRDNLFDAFVTHGKKNGTGLGTAIAKKIVGDHGGTITFTTVTGAGTTFCIQLPAGS